MGDLWQVVHNMLVCPVDVLVICELDLLVLFIELEDFSDLGIIFTSRDVLVVMASLLICSNSSAMSLQRSSEVFSVGRVFAGNVEL